MVYQNHIILLLFSIFWKSFLLFSYHLVSFFLWQFRQNAVAL